MALMVKRLFGVCSKALPLGSFPVSPIFSE